MLNMQGAVQVHSLRLQCLLFCLSAAGKTTTKVNMSAHSLKNSGKSSLKAAKKVGFFSFLR